MRDRPDRACAPQSLNAAEAVGSWSPAFLARDRYLSGISGYVSAGASPSQQGSGAGRVVSQRLAFSSVGLSFMGFP